MKRKKSWFNNIDDNTLDAIINNKEVIEKVPDYLDNKVKKIISENTIIINKQEQNKKFVITNIYFRAALAAAMFLFITSSLFFYIILRDNSKNDIITTIENTNGLVKIIRNNSTIKTGNGEKIKKNDIIATNEKSNLNLRISNKSMLEVEKSTKLKVLALTKEKENEKNRFYLEKGKVTCQVTLPTKESIFEVLTDIAKISVKGTKFSVEITKQNELKVEVEVGNVEISNFIKKPENFEKIPQENTSSKKLLEKFLNKKEIVAKNKSIVLTKNEIEKINNELIKIVDEVNDKKNNNEEKELIKTIQELDNKYDDIIKKNENSVSATKTISLNEESKLSETEISEENKDSAEKNIIEKLPNNPCIVLTEKNTAISSFNNDIYISSDSNKSIYSIDAESGKLKWKFNHKELKNVSSPAINHKNKIIVGTPESVFILNNNGSLDKIEKLESGIIYWASSIVIKDVLFIPTSKSIYMYDGLALNILSNFNTTGGQLYISYYENKLFIQNLNEKNIIIYDLNEKREIWRSEKMKERSFIPPVYTGKFIITADSRGNIYRYDDSKNGMPNIININTGVMTNLIYKNSFIYFIANDGYFYKLNIIAFDNCNKIIKVDNNPNADKYQTKKLFSDSDDVYFCSDIGELFNYNIKNGKAEIIKNNLSVKNVAFFGTPIKIGVNIYAVDIKSNIYKLVKK